MGCAFNLEQKHKEELARTIHVSVYSYENGIARGVLRSVANGQKVPFYGLDQAVLEMKKILENQSLSEWKLESLPLPQMSDTPQNFLIRIRGRENQSLQGELQTDGKRCCFRSGMELMGLMHHWMQRKSGEASACRRGNRKPLQRTRGFTVYKRGRKDEL